MDARGALTMGDGPIGIVLGHQSEADMHGVPLLEHAAAREAFDAFLAAPTG